MTTSVKKRIPVKEGLWTEPKSPREKPSLIGSKCPACGQVYFPKREKQICIRCQHKGLDEVKLSRRGKIYSFSIIMQAPTAYYIGKVPYAYGVIKLPEGVRVRTHFTGCDFKDLKLNMPVELVIEKLGEDEQGNEVMAHKFKPVSK
ncbi:MAG TPA: OB-fold domain-containing protein [Dehalococcoidales bacterium]